MRVSSLLVVVDAHLDPGAAHELVDVELAVFNENEIIFEGSLI